MPRNGWKLGTDTSKVQHDVCGKWEFNSLEATNKHVCKMNRFVAGIDRALDNLASKPKVAASAKTSKGEAMVKEPRPSTILVEFKDAQGNLLGSLVGARRTFSSGSTGYGCYGKIGAKGSSQGYYQVSANVVEVGTKPTK